MIPVFEKYLAKHPKFIEPINTYPNKRLNNLIIIPVYNEPNAINTLKSLKNCNPAKQYSEVIIIINHCEYSPQEIKEQNHKSLNELSAWCEINSTIQLRFHILFFPNMPKKYAGVGLARKIGMDEAVSRLSRIKNKNGILISLDADTTVSKNYLVVIEKTFAENQKLNTLLPWFEHQIKTETPEVQKAIIQYELYLRYFKLALKFTNFPYAYHTIGSAFAVKAMAYVKQGGMNKKQGGEDFYFLQKVFCLGYTKEINHVKVFPSGRISDRVPFGTGPAIGKIISDGDFLTYQPNYFFYLKEFFSQINKFYNNTSSEIATLYHSTDKTIQDFVPLEDFQNKISEIKNNSSTIDSFRNRFFQWFDAFKVIKYLNTNHNAANRIPIINAANAFLSIVGDNQNKKYNALELLNKLKDFEINT